MMFVYIKNGEIFADFIVKVDGRRAVYVAKDNEGQALYYIQLSDTLKKEPEERVFMYIAACLRGRGVLASNIFRVKRGANKKKNKTNARYMFD